MGLLERVSVSIGHAFLVGARSVVIDALCALFFAHRAHCSDALRALRAAHLMHSSTLPTGNALDLLCHARRAAQGSALSINAMHAEMRTEPLHPLTPCTPSCAGTHFIH